MIKRIIFLVLLPLFLFSQDKEMRGFSIAGLPSASYSDGEGFKLGASVNFYQYGDGAQKPYNWTLLLDGSISTEKLHEYLIFLDMPHVWGKGTRLNVLAEYKQHGREQFYGLGNKVIYNENFVDKDHIDFINNDYYYFKHNWVAFIANAQFPVFHPGITLLTGVGVFNHSTNFYDTPNLFYDFEPFGANGGVTSYVRFGLVYDSRDQDTIPTKGVWSEALLEVSDQKIKSDYNYARLTLTDRRYFSLFPRLVYAQRILFETLPGSPPYYETSIIAGSYKKQSGLGGRYTLRGMPRYVLIGQTKFATNHELRIRTARATILRQIFTGYIHLFFDTGKVWQKGDAKNFSNLHTSHGMGIAIRWNQDFVGSLDVGRSKYNNFAVYIKLGVLF